MRYYLGIDPGKSGAIAILDANSEFIMVYDCPETETARLGILEEYFPNIAGAALEKAQAMSHWEKVPGGRKILKKQGVSSAFKFGENYGIWKGILIASNIPFLTPHPKRWQKMLDSPLDMKPKERVIEYVSRRWPMVELKKKKDHNRADAVCLAEYARREFR